MLLTYRPKLIVLTVTSTDKSPRQYFTLLLAWRSLQVLKHIQKDCGIYTRCKVTISWLFYTFYVQSEMRSTKWGPELKWSLVIRTWKRVPLNNLIQAKVYFLEVVSKWSHPSLTYNYSILDDVESFWCCTISNICCVEHCIDHYWNPSRQMRQQKLSSRASFLNGAVLTYLVVVLKQNAMMSKISPRV